MTGKLLTGTLSLQSNQLKKSTKLSPNQRTNGPVNAHLRSAVYTNVIENIPSIGADEALFFRIINIQCTVHTSFSLQMTF